MIRIAIALMAMTLAIGASAQTHVREVANKVREITDAKVPMTNVVKRSQHTGAVELTVVQATNLPAKITKEIVKAMEKDEKSAYDSQKSVRGNECTRIMKFTSKSSNLSVVVTYNPSNFTNGTVMIREDFNNAAGRRRRIIYEIEPTMPTANFQCLI